MAVVGVFLYVVGVFLYVVGVFLYVVGVFLYVVGVFLYTVTLTRPGPDTAVATRSLPAYHLLTRSDLDPPDPGLTGRYTLRAVSESHPVDTTALGPKLAPGSLTGRVITTLRGQPQAARLFGQDQHLPPRPPESVTAAGGPGEERADASVVLESGYDAAWATPQPGGPEGALW